MRRAFGVTNRGELSWCRGSKDKQTPNAGDVTKCWKNRWKKTRFTTKKASSIYLKLILLLAFLYAAPEWSGYIHIADIEGVQKMVDKAKRWQIVLQDYNFVELFNKGDNALFRASFHNHCLNHFHPLVKQQIHCMTLWRHGHNFAWPVFRYWLANNLHY